VIKQMVLFALLGLPIALIAQNPESTTGGEASVSVGVEGSAFNPDWGCPTSAPICSRDELLGPTALFDFDWHGRFGAEGEARWLHWHGLGGQVESNYLLGPRYRVFRHARWDVWAKLEFGGALITTPDYPSAGSLKGSYFAYVPGVSLAYRLTHHLSLRGDYEWQVWPSFAESPTYNSTTGTVQQNNNGLTPNGISVGVVYRLLGP
jgi:hypothetical protein